jgi:hypothetical protein
MATRRSHVSAVIAHLLPFQAGNRLVAIPFDGASAYLWTLTGAWMVVGTVWALAAVTSP